MAAAGRSLGRSTEASWLCTTTKRREGELEEEAALRHLGGVAASVL
jgi:hypothetical protein